MTGPLAKLKKQISHLNIDFKLISLSLLIFSDGMADQRFIFSLIISILMFFCGMFHKCKLRIYFFIKIKNQAKLWEIFSLTFNLIFIIFSFYVEEKLTDVEIQKEQILKYSVIEFFYLILYKVPSFTCVSLIVFSIFISFRLKIDGTITFFLILMNIFHIGLRFKKNNKEKVNEIQRTSVLNLQSLGVSPSQAIAGIVCSTKLNHSDLNFPDTSDLILVIDRNKEVIQTNFRLSQVLKQENIDYAIYFREWNFKIKEKQDGYPILEELNEQMLNLYQKKNLTPNGRTLTLNELLDESFSTRRGENFYLVLAEDKEGKEYFMHLYLNNEQVLVKIIQNYIFPEWLEFRSEKTLFSNYLNYVEHEFRTPLNCIINILQILEDYIEPEMGATIITPALISSKLLLNSLSNFIDFGKIKTYTYESNNVEFDLPSLLYESVEIVKNRAANREISIKQNIDDQIRTVNNDQSRIRQILINLLENALSLTAKGSITLSVQIINLDQIEISVIDTGMGFLSDDQIKIKEAFDKRNLKEIDVLKGNLISLGVLISNAIAQNLKGATKGLVFSSVFNEGNNFRFRFNGYKNMHIEECVTESHRNQWIHLPKNSCKMINDVLLDHETYSFKQMESINSFQNTKKDEMNSLTKISVCSCFSKNSKLKRSKSSSKNSKNSKHLFISEVMMEDPMEENFWFQSSSKNSKNSKHSKFIFVSEARSCLNEEPIQSPHELDMSLEKELNIVRGFVKLRPCQCPLALIIDDNDFNILALQLQLKRLDIISEKALSADRGIELIKNISNNECCDTFKIIFLDIEMPVKNGFQAYEEIKQFYEHFKLKNLCVVIVTAHGQNSQLVKDVKQMGVTEVISKPLSMESLILLLLKLHKSLILT